MLEKQYYTKSVISDDIGKLLLEICWHSMPADWR